MHTHVGARVSRLPFQLARPVRTLALFALFWSVFSGPLWAQDVVTRVSVGPGGVEGNGDSYGRDLSANGRFVAFESNASNLVAGDNNGVCDVFVHDRETGTTTRVSVGPGGVEGNGESYGGALSADGRFVAFESDASNLVIGDNNASRDVFVHDRQTGVTTRVSLGPAGVEGNSASFSPAMSADGRFVAFYSYASNLVGGDTNEVPDVFVHDRDTGITTRVSVGPGGAEGSGESSGSAISADGRFVAFHSYASNLVGGDTNEVPDVFVHDRQTGTTTRVSVGPGGAEGNGESAWGTISAEGRFVAFGSFASNLVDGDTNGVPDVFVHDRQTGTTTRIGDDWGESWTSILSADGRFVAFEHRPGYWGCSGDYWDCWYSSGWNDLFVYELATGATRLVKKSGAQGSDGYSYVGGLNADGRFVAFSSEASTLVAGDTNGVRDVFVRDGAAVGKSSPTDGATGQPIPLSPDWSSIWWPGGVDPAYEYCYDTVDNDVCDSAWIASGGPITELLPGTTYFWQVRAGTTYADGGTWWSFTTAPLPGTFAKTGPANGETQQTVPLTLTWTTSSGATSYEFCYDTVDNAACDRAWLNTTGTTAVLTWLTGITTYYWQVRARSASGTIDSDGGTWWVFTTSPLAPPPFQKSYPANGQMTAGNPVFTWSSSSGEASYEFCVDTVNDGACSGSWVSTGTNRYTAVSGLSPETVYYWQVRTANTFGTTEADNGTWWAFTVSATPPSAFGKVAPADGAPGPTYRTLTWSASSGATSYAVCYDTSNDGACGTAWQPAGTTTSFGLTGLAPGTYYWQVRATNASGTTEADSGAWRSFQVFSPPPAFGKVAPANGTIGLGNSPTLTWSVSSGVTDYLLCVDTTNDSACSTPWQWVGPATSLALSGLAAGTYYWQVRAVSTVGSTDADGGTWWAFSVSPTPPLFGKVAPTSGTTGLGGSVTLTWTPVADAGYWVCWDTTNNNVCDGMWWPNGGVTARPLTGLPPGTYYWQIRAQQSAGTTDADAGTWWAFTVGGPPQPPAAFAKAAPVSGTSGLGSAVSLGWSASTGAASYEVCVDTTDDAACGGAWQTTGAAASFGLSGLAAGTYYWLVRAVNSAGTTYADGGTWWAFSVSPTPPLFGKVGPTSGTTGLGGSVTLTWTPVADAGYWVCWDTTNNNVCDGMWWPNGGGAGRVLTGLPAGTYYWQVRAQRSSGTTDADAGTWWAFTVGGPPQPPAAFAKTAPASGTSGLGSAVSLAWSASTGAASYEVCVDTTDDAACGGAWQTTGAAASFGLSGLPAGTYYWLVRAVNSAGTTYADGGTWWAFSVSPTPPLFTKVGPADGAADLGSSVMLQWTPATDAGYWVCWDTTNNNACDGMWWPNGGVTARPLTGLPSGTYYWQVRAQQSAGTTDADAGRWWTFTVR